MDQLGDREIGTSEGKPSLIHIGSGAVPFRWKAVDIVSLGYYAEVRRFDAAQKWHEAGDVRAMSSFLTEQNETRTFQTNGGEANETE